jgi:SAM-dependent methyltransferase
VTGVDHDPVTLALARTHERDGWLRIVDADLQQASWAGLVEGPFDAVVSATALHWLPAGHLERTYAAARSLLRPGGLLLNSDTMPPAGAALTTATSALHDGLPQDAWAAWWRAVEAEPALAGALAQRSARRGAGVCAEFTPPSRWHLDALVRAGFCEADVVWCRSPDAVVAAAAP